MRPRRASSRSRARSRIPTLSSSVLRPRLAAGDRTLAPHNQLRRAPIFLQPPAATRADPHDADPGQPEAECQCAMGEAVATKTSDLVVALRLDAAREPAGENGSLRDADPERLRHDTER